MLQSMPVVRVTTRDSPLEPKRCRLVSTVPLQHNPEKAATIDEIMFKWTGRERKLLKTIQSKYEGTASGEKKEEL